MLTKSTLRLGRQYDGETHIYFNMKGTTALGRFLATPTFVELVTEQGNFQSIEGYYRYLQYLECCRKSGVTVESVAHVIDKLKTVSGLDAIKTHGAVRNELKQNPDLILKIDPFEELAVATQRAVIQKLKSNPQFMAAAFDNTLPYYNYFDDGKRFVNDDRFQWYPRQVENAINLMREIYQ